MGISTRKVEAVAGELGVRSMSKSQVSRLCECLDAEVDAFRGSASTGCASPTCGSTPYVKCRVEGRSASQAVVTADGLDDTPQALRRRGLRGHESHAGCGRRSLRPGGRAASTACARRLGRPRRAREGDSRDVPRSGLAALRHAPHAQRGAASTGRTTRERGARGHEGRLRAEEPRPRARACYQEATEEVLKISRAAGKRALWRPRRRRSPTWRSGHAPHQDPHQQRPGEANREIKADARRAGGSPARVAHPPGGSGAHRGRRGVVGALRHLHTSLAHAWKPRSARRPRRGRKAACEAARKIIGSAIDPKETKAKIHSQGCRRFSGDTLIHHDSGRTQSGKSSSATRNAGSYRPRLGTAMLKRTLPTHR